MADYQGRAEVFSYRGVKIDDVMTRLIDRGRFATTTGSMTNETTIGWRRFQLAGSQEYLMRLPDGRELEIAVDAVPIRPGTPVSFRCPRGVPQEKDRNARWRKG